MSVLLTAKFNYISTLLYSAFYLKLTVKLMSGFEMCDMKNYIFSMAEKKIQIFNKDWLDKCCLALFSYLNTHSLCGVRRVKAFLLCHLFLPSPSHPLLSRERKIFKEKQCCQGVPGSSPCSYNCITEYLVGRIY